MTSKQVDNLTDQLLQINNELSSLTDRTKANSDTILNISEDIKKTNELNGDAILRVIESVKLLALKLTNIETELTSIKEDSDDQFEQVSKKINKITSLVSSNSRNLEKVIKMIKKGKSKLTEPEDDIEHSIDTDDTFTDSKEDTEPTAILMELVCEIKLPHNGNPTSQVCIGPNDEIINIDNSGNIYVSDKFGVLLRSFKGELSSRLKISKEGDIISGRNVYSLNGQLKGTITLNDVTDFPFIDDTGQKLFIPPYVKPSISDNGDTYILDGNMQHRCVSVFNSDRKFLRKFPVKNYMPLLNSLGVLILCNNNLYVIDNYLVNVYNLEGKHLFRFNMGQDTYGGQESIRGIVIFNSGELGILSYGSPSYILKIYKSKTNYIQKSLKYSFDFVIKNNLNLDDNVKLVTFPLTVPPFEDPNILRNLLGEPKNKYNNTSIFSHTIYFNTPKSVKEAILSVQEYFREKVTESDFKHLCSLLALEDIKYRKYLNIYNYNWAKCHKNRLVRGYFLGGNVLESFDIVNGDELILNITHF